MSKLKRAIYIDEIEDILKSIEAILEEGCEAVELQSKIEEFIFLLDSEIKDQTTQLYVQDLRVDLKSA